ncbi:peroxide stress protein YaaA [Nakamurella antarctica]|uniref:Peroxide stress protein YaaA n=1 Tax=Nakamurella antarctica TaxID=1902245 RepID=A0A3G8ZMS7_9ACTN|nr:peroxide stress protein YaaA [Nakamurella antarctica]AZI58107.1 peroxide stress protein YaaA [Nakamurella antarctica]
MFILLPPSETKLQGGDGTPLDVHRLAFPSLTASRLALMAALSDLCSDLPAARKALGVASTKDPELLANLHLTSAPTMPALNRYTGVLFDHLAVGTMTRVERARADSRIMITSALFGMVAASDPIPAYRLSAGSILPGVPTISAWWKPHLSPILANIDGPVIDLRSSSYASFAPAPGAIRVQVMTETSSGERTVVSHFNKATKGDLARILSTSRATIDGVSALLKVARRAGMAIERTSPNLLTVVT